SRCSRHEVDGGRSQQAGPPDQLMPRAHQTHLQGTGWTAPNGIDVPECGLSEPATKEPPKMSITMIGLDTAKSVFHVHGVNEAGKAELKRKLRRSELIPFFEKQERCTVVMEACGAA